jgi:hypothetical protein
MESCENYSQYLDALDMQRYYKWINSEDPAAIAERKSNEIKTQQHKEKARKQQTDYEIFIAENPDVVNKCKVLAVQQLDGLVEGYLLEEFEKYKIRKYFSEKYKQIL